MHKPESVLENETHRILWDCEIQTDHSIPAMRPDLIIVKKNSEPADLWKSQGRQVLGPSKKTKKNYGIWK